MTALTHLNFIDFVIIALYFIFILGIGFYVKEKTKNSADFFLAGRKNTSWIAGLAFLSANMGALELLGMSGQSYAYGVLTAHFYLIGAVPAMLFLAIYMMPFYYATRIHSIPQYLNLRFNGATRTLNAYAFAIVTLLMSGINMYAMALVLNVFVGWNFNSSVWVASATVACYIALGGLASAIFSEVMQFFIIWFGLFLAVILGYVHIGGAHEIIARLPTSYLHLWKITGSPQNNLMGIEWFGIALGLGFVLSFGYWTTDFLVIQRAFSAKDLSSARMAPIIASFFKMALPIIVVGAGLLVLTLEKMGQLPALDRPDEALLYLVNLEYPHGLLGLGVTALLAGFMAGQAGNVSAFNTVFTYDIYRAHFVKNASDSHYLMVGRIVTILGILLSILTAYGAKSEPTIMEYMQALFSIVNAPLFGIIFLGMFFPRINGAGAFWGLLVGMLSAAISFFATEFHWFSPAYIAFNDNASLMAINFWRAIWAFIITGSLTILISLLTDQQPRATLEGLIFEKNKIGSRADVIYWRRPGFWALISIAIFIAINAAFW
ncbi:MAG: Na+/galactose cotransporter [Coxiella sp. RIFCSPHIGHO2_12_FULL_42_15]|nr:MAG: Na+/galactose cotransporter [Coxiella sp. RIFCSPHIGHO2_12_FULL_42_15]